MENLNEIMTENSSFGVLFLGTSILHFATDETFIVTCCQFSFHLAVIQNIKLLIKQSIPALVWDTLQSIATHSFLLANHTESRNYVRKRIRWIH
jgi:hypothetical protein